MSIIHDALKKVDKEETIPSADLTPSLKPSPVKDEPQTHKPSWRFPGLSYTQNLVGIDIGTRYIKLIKLHCKNGSCRLEQIGFSKLQNKADTQAIVTSLNSLLKSNRIGHARVASAITGKTLTFSHIKLPKMPPEDLAEAVRWEVKKGIDYPDDAVIDYVINDEIIEEGRLKLSIMAFAVKREEVANHVNILKKASLIPQAIDVCSMAMLSAFDYNYGWEKDKRYAIMDIGASRTTLSIVSNGTLRLTRHIPLGGDDITRFIQDADGLNFDAGEEKKIRHSGNPAEAPESVKEAFRTFMDGITMELKRSFTYYQAHLREGQVETLFVSGGSARIKGLPESIEKGTGITTQIYDITKKVDMAEDLRRSTDLSYISPLFVEAFGLALRRSGE